MKNINEFQEPVFTADDTVSVKAPAKINLTLDVTGVRNDGYHLLQMVMQSVSIYDELTLKLDSTGNITLSSTPEISGLPPEKNLVYRAVLAMKEKYDLKYGFNIRLKKNIPAAAGLAGGSSDCAAALRAVRTLMMHFPASSDTLSDAVSDSDLCSTGVSLGADVPFCVSGGTVFCEGIGEILTPLESLNGIPVLIVKPAVSVPTGGVYKKLDAVSISHHPDNESMLRSVSRHDIEGISRYLENVLELVTIPENPVIRDIKNDMLDAGALNSLMSGSGPSVFGIFRTRTESEKASEILEKKYPEAFVHACTCL